MPIKAQTRRKGRRWSLRETEKRRSRKSGLAGKRERDLKKDIQ